MICYSFRVIAPERLLQIPVRAKRRTGRRRATATQVGDLHAPMAGKIIHILVRPGERVKAGTTLLIMEAMQMEQHITAPHDGVVSRLLCSEGDQVTAGAELVVLEPSSTGPTAPHAP